MLLFQNAPCKKALDDMHSQSCFCLIFRFGSSRGAIQKVYLKKSEKDTVETISSNLGTINSWYTIKYLMPSQGNEM
jgi:hypothetical protein